MLKNLLNNNWVIAIVSPIVISICIYLFKKWKHKSNQKLFIDKKIILQNAKTFNLKKLKGAYAWGGIDFSNASDLVAGVIIVTLENDNNLYVIPQGFMCAEKFKNLKKINKIKYKKWEKRKVIKIVGDSYVEHKEVISWFKKMKKKYNLIIQSIGFDIYSTENIMNDFRYAGFRVEKINQDSITFLEPMNKLKKMLKESKVAYNKNPLFVENMRNVELVIEPNSNEKPYKKLNKTNKINIFLAILNAIVLENKDRPRIEWIYGLRREEREEK